jgi:hypothetical protein
VYNEHEQKIWNPHLNSSTTLSAQKMNNGVSKSISNNKNQHSLT